MIYESVGAVWLSNATVTRDSSSLIFLSPDVPFGLSNPCVTRYSSSLMIYESVGAVWLSNATVTRDSSSLMIYESLRAVSDVKCICHTLLQFVDDFLAPRGCLGCRIHASLVTAVPL